MAETQGPPMPGNGGAKKDAAEGEDTASRRKMKRRDEIEAAIEANAIDRKALELEIADKVSAVVGPTAAKMAAKVEVEEIISSRSVVTGTLMWVLGEADELPVVTDGR